MERRAGAGEGDCAVEVCAGSELQIEAGGLTGGDRSRKRASERECGCRVGENVQDLRGTWGVIGDGESFASRSREDGEKKLCSRCNWNWRRWRRWRRRWCRRKGAGVGLGRWRGAVPRG